MVIAENFKSILTSIGIVYMARVTNNFITILLESNKWDFSLGLNNYNL